MYQNVIYCSKKEHISLRFRWMVDMPTSNATGPPALQHMAIQALDGCFGFLNFVGGRG